MPTRVAGPNQLAPMIRGKPCSTVVTSSGITWLRRSEASAMVRMAPERTWVSTPGSAMM